MASVLRVFINTDMKLHNNSKIVTFTVAVFQSLTFAYNYIVFVI